MVRALLTTPPYAALWPPPPDCLGDDSECLARACLDQMRKCSLEPGDIVTTGTPAGVGCFRNPPRYLIPGDVVSVEVEKVGRLTNPVVAGY